MNGWIRPVCGVLIFWGDVVIIENIDRGRNAGDGWRWPKESCRVGFLSKVVGVLGPTAHPGLPLKVLFGVGRCYRL
jgi:hypothetical protein